MQRHSSNGSEIKIPPILLKNFNPYDILEPQKNCVGNSDATKVDKLIDIDDCSRDSGFQDSDLPPAFRDKNRDFDVIDVFQNIFVTPQHIKKKVNDDTIDDVDGAFGVSKIDPGFTQFFDKLESGEKVDWLNISQPQENFTDHEFIDKKPRVLVPKVFTEPDSDPEDLIQEVLMQKKMEQIALGNINNSRKVSEVRERESLKKVSEKHNPVFKVPEKVQPAKEPEVIPEFSRSSFMNNVMKDSKLFNGSNEKFSRPSELYQDSQINNTLTNFTVKAIQKDEKIYKKKRLVKPEHQTANYTKGPDFYEKSVVLPQIMARLNARLAYLDQKGNQKKRLILDSGAPKPKPECSPANVNTQVKKSTNQVSSNAKVQVNSQPESKTFTKNDLIKKAPNKAGSSGINSINMNNIPIKPEARLCLNKLTKDIRVHSTDKPCTNCGNPSSSTKGYVPSNTYEAELTPVVLMEDCNKERLRALKRSQMFKEFVLKGKNSH